jgi:hypothetical protein
MTQDKPAIPKPAPDKEAVKVKDCDAPAAPQHAVDAMFTSQFWWPEIHLGTEGDIAQRYGSAK